MENPAHFRVEIYNMHKGCGQTLHHAAPQVNIGGFFKVTPRS